MRKLESLLLVLLLLPISMLAADTALVVERTNGQTANYLLKDNPTLPMTGTQLKIETATMQASYERADVKNFYFTKAATSVKEVTKNNITFKQIDASHLEIIGLSQGEHIIICDMSGRQLGNVSRINNKAVIDLSGYQQGAYIIKVGNGQTIKLIKK